MSCGGRLLWLTLGARPAPGNQYMGAFRCNFSMAVGSSTMPYCMQKYDDCHCRPRRASLEGDPVGRNFRLWRAPDDVPATPIGSSLPVRAVIRRSSGLRPIGPVVSSTFSIPTWLGRSDHVDRDAPPLGGVVL